MTINTDDPNDARNYSVPLGNANSQDTVDPTTKAVDDSPCDPHPFVVQLAKYLKVYKYIGVWTLQIDRVSNSVEFRIKCFMYQEDPRDQKSNKTPH